MALFETKCVDLKNNSSRDCYGKFILGPLDRGHGITIGNALRRVLLSDLEGTTITAIKIAGVRHEFSTIDGVREDILEILLNLREVVFKGSSEEVFIGNLKVQGPSIITAGNFNLPAGVVVIDPTQYVATICNNNILEIDFKIEVGKGYHIVEKPVEQASADFFQVDAVFMPVRKVNYFIDEVRQDTGVLKDVLVLEIWTNGSLSPQEALSEGSTVLISLFSSLKMIPFFLEEDKFLLENFHADQLLIEELQLSVRSYNCLKRAQIYSIADLLDYSQEDLLKIKNFGQKSAEEVIKALQKRLGITLPKEKDMRVKKT